MKKIIKKIWSWCKWIIFILVGIFTYHGIKKIVAKIGPVKENKVWIPVNKTTIKMYDKKGNSQEIKLPKDPVTKKQLTVNDIECVGITEKGNINVKIKHIITNRRLSNANNN